eukprot:423139-Rhodomonas_salina.2
MAEGCVSCGVRACGSCGSEVHMGLTWAGSMRNGTGLWYSGGALLRAWYAMSGTEIAHGGTRI